MNIIITIVGMFLSFVAFSSAQGDHEAFKKKMHEAHDLCEKEVGVDNALLTSALKDGKFTDDQKLKCYFKCFLQKLGRMDANGKLNFSSSLDHIPPDADKAKVTAILDKCQSSKGTDDCDTAYLGAKCFREAIGPMYHKAKQ